MKINIKTTNFNITDNTRGYIFKKIDKLNKLTINIKLPQEIRIEVGRTTDHHRKGDDLFKTEANLKIGGKLLRSVAEEWNIKVAIDNMYENLEREVQKFKDKKSVSYKRGARKAKEMMRESI